MTDWIYPIITNGTLTFNNLKIKSSDISSNTKLRILFNFQEVKLDLQFAIIKGNNEKPILNNIISDNQTIKYGQISKPFTLSSLPYLDYTIACNYRACNSSRDYRYINTFKWQTRTQNTNWTDIPNATTQEYSPNKNFTENTYYRRLAFNTTEQYSISNTASILIEDSNIKNTICCDQSFPLKNSQPNEISGNELNSNNYTYQWQFAKNTRGNEFLPWHDINGATNQNYKHVYSEDATTNDEKTKFRRLLKLNSLPITTSNEIIILRYTTIPFPPTRRDGTTSLRSQSLTNFNTFTPESAETDINNTIIYPNPFLNNFSIEGSISIDDIKLYDSFGKIINIEKTQKSENIIEVNTSNLQSGVFLLKVDNTIFSKTIFKN